MKIMNKIRYFLIEKLAGDMPIILNVNICRPKDYSGNLVYFPNANLPAMFCNNVTYNKEKDSIITPIRDVNLKDDL